MKNVILASNPYRDKNFQNVREAMGILKAAGISARLCLPFDVDRSFELPKDLRFSKLDRELGSAELIICFGGDGTILHMAKSATRRGIPLLGVNIGTMGFMAELESTELDRLSQLATGEYTVDSRMMLDVTVQRDRDIIYHDICLNDVVITKGAIARIVHLDVRCDGAQAMSIGGDGVIVATPTGSTAYALSAGGPVIEPDLECIEMHLICPHSLFSRAMLFSPERTLTLLCKSSSEESPLYMSFDGETPLKVSSNSRIEISKSRYKIPFVDFESKNAFHESLSKKLMQSIK